MTNIEVLVDSKGKLSLKKFHDASNKVELSLKEKEAAIYLERLSSSMPMRDVQVGMQSGEVNNISVRYDQYFVQLINCKKLESKEALLKPFLTKVGHKLENQKLERMKRERDSFKVTRSNKHTKGRIVAGMVAFSMFVGGIVSLANAKEESSLKKEVPSLSNIEVLDDEKESNPIFENLNFVENVNYDAGIVKEDKKGVEFTSQIDEVVNPLTYEDRSQTPKAINAKEAYGAIIESYANQYGIDPNLMMAIATQESGVHTKEMSKGGATGLMQIQNSVWENKPIQAYNYETNQVDSFTVRKEMLGDVYKNIQIGCMYFQNCMESMNHNTLAAVQCYNMGYGNMGKILNAYAQDKGVTKEEILNDPNDFGWLSYRNIISRGDSQYVEHVLSWMEDSTSVFLGGHKTNSVITMSNESSSGLKVR